MYSFTEEDIARYKSLLEECEETSLVVRRKFTGFDLYSDCPDVETELSMGIIYGRQVILSRVLLRNQRCGTMTKIFQLSLDICRKHGIPKFVVQSTVTPAMVNWCVKHGLAPVEYTTAEYDGVIYGDYAYTLNLGENPGKIKQITLG